jgi:type IV secretory pathway TraG/TraD family ATPase VirD4
MKKLATPNLFKVFSEDSFDLAINKVDTAAFVSLVNSPSKESVFSPVLAMTSKLMIDLMSEPGREPCTLLIDEASTLKIPKLDKILATLRTYKMWVTWGLQDKIQGEILYDHRVLKAIISNLSTKFIGKANDPDTAEWYTKLIETVEIEQKSYSMKDSSFGSSSDKRLNVSKQEKAKYKAFEFNRLKQGEFVILDDKANDFKDTLELIADFATLEAQNALPKRKQKHHLSEAELEEFYNSVFDTVESIKPDFPDED